MSAQDKAIAVLLQKELGLLTTKNDFGFGFEDLNDQKAIT
jgi:hypothetical protein